MKLVIPESMPAAISLGRGRWRTSEPWSVQIEGISCLIPKGFVTDLFSIPFPFSIVLPDDEKDNRPALIHDWLYATVGLRPTAQRPSVFEREACDKALESACQFCGFSPAIAWAIHAGVRIGGGIAWASLAKRGSSLANPEMD